MKIEKDFHVPNCEEFQTGYESYKRENKGPIYFDALNIITENWGNAEGMAKGINRIVRGWNRFYANFDFDSLVKCIEINFAELNQFKNRDIETLSDDDTDVIKNLFIQFNEALKRTKDGAKSPVSVAKALSPLAPQFFPLWDSNIASEYDCWYSSDTDGGPYVRFCGKMKLMSEAVGHCVPDNDDRSLLKRIDEYNYSKYTMGWL